MTDWRAKGMSNLNAIGLILATLLAGGFLITYLARTLNKRIDAILTGVIDGTRVSRKHRQLMLYNMYFQYLGGMIALSIIIALGLVQMGDHVSDSGIKNLAYVAAVLAGFPAFTWSILGTSSGLYCARVLRQAEAD
jgi:hypothetical protein